jgi:flagellar biosynthesis protein FlhA
MDGAGKFVQGDVNAGMVITLINIIGGVLLGVLQRDMSWTDAMHTYTLLTVGDGLVATIPSIITSTAAGIIVSRAAAEAKMGEEFLGQLTYHTRALYMVSGVLILFSLIPGLPMLPFMAIGATILLVARLSQQVREAEELALGGASKSLRGTGKAALAAGSSRGAGNLPATRSESALDTPEEVPALLPLDVLELEVGYGLVPLVDENQNGNLLSRIRSLRRQFALDMGVILPSLHLRDNLQLKPGQYSLLVKGNEVASAEILIDHFLAMDPGNAKSSIRGIETREPAFNLPAVWIPEAQKEEAMLAGYTVVDPSTVIATHLTEVFRRHLVDFLGRQETQGLLDNLAKTAPKAVEELVPGILSLGTVQKVLQNLVRESVSIRDLLTIVETLADHGLIVKSAEMLTEYVRERLSRTIVKPYLDSQGALPIITLEPKAEQILQESIRQTENGVYLALAPGTAQRLMQQINQVIERSVNTDGQPVVLVSPMSRPHLAQLVMRFLPSVPVLSQAEIPMDIRLNSVGNAGVD